MGWAIEGKDQKQNGGLLCFLGAKGLFFNSLIVGLVLLTPRVCHGLGPDPRQTPGSASVPRAPTRPAPGRCGVGLASQIQYCAKVQETGLSVPLIGLDFIQGGQSLHSGGRRKGLKLRSLLRQKSLSLETERGREKQQQV